MQVCSTPRHADKASVWFMHTISGFLAAAFHGGCPTTWCLLLSAAHPGRVPLLQAALQLTAHQGRCSSPQAPVPRQARAAGKAPKRPAGQDVP